MKVAAIQMVSGISLDHNLNEALRLLRQAAQAGAELAVLQIYLPTRLSAEEVAAEVQAIVADLGAKGPGDMGKVMGAVKARLAGKADMGAVSAAVKAALAA